MGLRINQDDVGFASYLYALNSTFLRVKQGGMETNTFMDGYISFTYQSGT